MTEEKGNAIVDSSYLYKMYKQMADADSSVSPLGPQPQPRAASSVLLSNLPSVTVCNNALIHVLHNTRSI